MPLQSFLLRNLVIAPSITPSYNNWLNNLKVVSVVVGSVVLGVTWFSLRLSVPSRLKRYNHSVLILYKLFHYGCCLIYRNLVERSLTRYVSTNVCFSALFCLSFNLNPLSNLGLVEAYHIGENKVGWSQEQESPRCLSKTDLAICSPDRKSKPE